MGTCAATHSGSGCHNFAIKVKIKNRMCVGKLLISCKTGREMIAEMKTMMNEVFKNKNKIKYNLTIRFN